MTKHKPYSRREFTRLFRAWLRRNRLKVAVLTLGVAALLTVETVVLVVLPQPTALSWWFLGAVQVAVVGILAHFMHMAFLAGEGRAMSHLRGSWGEENTRSELQRAKRKRLIWGWVDSIDLSYGDIDHLVVTRRGGLVVIDSKWRNQAGDAQDMARSAHRMRVRAEGIARSVLTKEGGARHRARANTAPVTPVVVIWGAAQESLPPNTHVDGIDFVRGGQLLAWLAAREADAVTGMAARDLVQRLERFRADAWSASGN